MKKIISLFIACSVLAGCCCEKCPQKTGYAPKYRKVALHGYVYRNVKTLEETVLEAKALGADGVVCSRTQKIAKRFGDAKFGIKMTPEQKEFVKKLFADNHIDFVSFGVWDIGKKETPDMYLSFCAEMGSTTTTMPSSARCLRSRSTTAPTSPTPLPSTSTSPACTAPGTTFI